MTQCRNSVCLLYFEAWEERSRSKLLNNSCETFSGTFKVLIPWSFECLHITVLFCNNLCGISGNKNFEKSLLVVHSLSRGTMDGLVLFGESDLSCLEGASGCSACIIACFNHFVASELSK